jgi:hypothetical protein
MERPAFTTPFVGEDASFELGTAFSKLVVIPAPINKYLKPHQREGVQFFFALYQQRKGGLLCDDMGLGKTVQVSDSTTFCSVQFVQFASPQFDWYFSFFYCFNNVMSSSTHTLPPQSNLTGNCVYGSIATQVQYSQRHNGSIDDNDCSSGYKVCYFFHSHKRCVYIC